MSKATKKGKHNQVHYFISDDLCVGVDFLINDRSEVTHLTSSSGERSYMLSVCEIHGMF